jgi:DNA-binding NtrC family response regulator
MDEEAVRVLLALPWKGNVRELDNVIEHTMILAEGERITLKDLPAAIVAGGLAAPGFTYYIKEALRNFEKHHIVRALEQAGQDRREAAKLLDISLSSLYRKIEELEIA